MQWSGVKIKEAVTVISGPRIQWQDECANQPNTLFCSGTMEAAVDQTDGKGQLNGGTTVDLAHNSSFFFLLARARSKSDTPFKGLSVVTLNHLSSISSLCSSPAR